MNRRPFGVIAVILLLFLSVNDAMAGDPGVVELRVADGDTLINICHRHLEDFRNWPEIAKLNKLANPNRIYPGQTLILPVPLLKGLPIDARITFVKGDVRRQTREGAPWEPVALNESLSEGTRIRTGKDAALEIDFQEGDTLLLRADTTVEMKASRQKSALWRVYRIFLEAGRVFSRVMKSTGAESRLEIHTPSAIAASRGTIYRVSQNAEAVTRCEVLQGQVRIAAMRKAVDLAQYEGTLVPKGKPPAPPRPLLPPPVPLDLKPLYPELPLTVRFSAVEGALRYRVRLATDTDFKDIIREQLVEPSDPTDIQGMADGRYFLQVLAQDASGLDGIPSKPLAVQVRVHPLPPYIQEPVSGKPYREGRIKLRWLKVKDAAAYRVQVASNQQFDPLILDTDAFPKTELLSPELEAGTYCFRVRSIAADGYAGLWSDPLSFEIIPPPPSPSMDKLERGDDGIHLRWKDLGPGMRYRLQVANDEAFTRILLDKTLNAPEALLPNPEAPGEYFVRIRSLAPDGYAGPFSPPQSFEVKGSALKSLLILLGVAAAILLL